MLRFLNAGESHGRALTVILEGMPAGLTVDLEEIDEQLFRRQSGYGRGGRMKIEKDRIQILSGIRHGKTMGSPITMQLNNRDWENWKQVMSTAPVKEKASRAEIREDSELEEVQSRVTRPRPGHADLAGAMKYGFSDLRPVLERASARETATRVAVGALTKIFLREFGIRILSHTLSIGSVKAAAFDGSFDQKVEERESSPVACLDSESGSQMMKAIDLCRESGDSLGGVIQVETTPLPYGLGSHVHWDRKLDGRLAGALLSIQAMKGIEFGFGFKGSRESGSCFHDQIYYHQEQGFYHYTNNAGGLEGGMTNGEPLIIRLAMKPIPTLYQPLDSTDLVSKEPFQASVERSDVCAVSAAGVVAENVTAYTLAQAFLEKFAGDNMEEVRAAYRAFQQRLSGGVEQD